jgi:Penicillin binding protein transpeptidase domain/Caspase domain
MTSVVALIGVSAYCLSEDALPALPEAAAGVSALGRALARRLDGRPVVRRLVDPPDADAIIEFVAEAAAAADETLLVYYCGHGLVDGTGALSLTHAGSDVTTAPGRDLPYERLRDLLAAAPARRTVLVLDCCYRGAGAPALLAGDRLRVPGAYVLTSTSTGRWEHTTATGQCAALTQRLADMLGSDGPDTLDAIATRLRTSMRADDLPLPLAMDDRLLGSLPIFQARPEGAVRLAPTQTRRPTPPPASRAGAPAGPGAPTVPFRAATGRGLGLAYRAARSGLRAALSGVPPNPGPTPPAAPYPPAVPAAGAAPPGAAVPPRPGGPWPAPPAPPAPARAGAPTGPAWPRQTPRRTRTAAVLSRASGGIITPPLNPSRGPAPPPRYRNVVVPLVWIAIAVVVIMTLSTVHVVLGGSTERVTPPLGGTPAAGTIYAYGPRAIATSDARGRFYPYGDTYADVTGYLTPTRSTGLEVAAASGNTVISTIRPAAQEAAVTALGQADGAVVALEPQTGQVLALAGWPRPDPNAIARVGDSALAQQNARPEHPLVNRATMWSHPGGPVLSLVTVAAALNAGRQPSDRVVAAARYRPPGGTTSYTTTDKRCTGPLLTLAEVAARSCEPALAALGVDVGGSRLNVMAGRFGLAGPIPDLGVAQTSAGPAAVAAGPDGADFALGRGGYAVTALQAAEVVAVIANHGTLVRPHALAESPSVADTTQPMFQTGADGVAAALTHGGPGTLAGCVPSTAGPTCWHLAFVTGRVAVAVVMDPDAHHRGRPDLAEKLATAVVDATD